MELDDAAQPRVLLCDDSKMIRATARKMLGESFDLVLAESGEQAWATITSDPTILAVFTDVTMPGLDGYGLLRRIREDERTGVNELPVIIVTGDQEESAREEALQHGATDFITKPFERSELIARANAYATRDQMRRQAQALQESQSQDTVTGLGNGRYLGSRLKSMRAYSVRHGLDMALIHLDLVDFDAIARTHGTSMAKRILREVGQVLAHRVREEDVLARVGKARFVALCPSCDRDGGQHLAQRLIQGVQETAFAGGDVRVGVAVGLHVPPGDPGIGLQAVYDAAQEVADRALGQGDGALEISPAEAPEGEPDLPREVPAAEEAAGETPAASGAEPTPTLEQALAMLAQPDGAQRLTPHLPELLERCVPLFEAAGPSVAAPVIERLRARIGEAQ